MLIKVHIMNLLIVTLTILFVFNLNVKAEELATDLLGVGDNCTVETEFEVVRTNNQEPIPVKPIEEEITLPSITPKQSKLENIKLRSEYR